MMKEKIKGKVALIPFLLTLNLYITQSQILSLENVPFDAITTENFSISTNNNLVMCDVPDTNKIECGFDGITEHECLYRDCCWNPINNNYPSCYYPKNTENQTDIGWIKVISCSESYGNSIYSYFHNTEISELAKYAITIKFEPDGGINNVKYIDFALMAKPCSNPIYALNNYKELSYVMNSDLLLIAQANINNWIGSNMALNRLKNVCFHRQGEPTYFAENFTSIIYGSCGNGDGIHIIPTRKQCEWDYGSTTAQNVNIYFGFHLNKMYYCNHTIITDQPTTNIPTTDIPTTNVPTTNIPTDTPTARPTTDVATSDVSTYNATIIASPSSTILITVGDNNVTFLIIVILCGISLFFFILLCIGLLLYAHYKRGKNAKHKKDEENIGKIQIQPGINIQSGIQSVICQDIKDNDNDDNDDTVHIGAKPNEKSITYFMQIISVDEDEFVIQLNSDYVDVEKRKFVIKESRNDNKNRLKDIKINIAKNKNNGAKIVDIDDDHDEKYDLLLYDAKNIDIPLPKSNEIRLSLLKNKDEFPPKNRNYRPNPIDLKTMTYYKDKEKKQVYVYWTIPEASFGNISYKIINANDTKTKYIKELPYIISMEDIDKSFRVITIVTIEDNIKYESVASEIINLCATQNIRISFSSSHSLYAQQNADAQSVKINDIVLPTPSMEGTQELPDNNNNNIDMEGHINPMNRLRLKPIGSMSTEIGDV